MTEIVSPNESLPVLTKWVGDEMMHLWSLPAPSEQRWLLAGAIAWGEHVKIMLEWMVPSMLAPDNLSALAPCWLLLYTDAAGFVSTYDALNKFAEIGITPIIRLIPEPVLSEIATHPSKRYWALGTAHNLMVRYAHRYRCGFHMAAPDHVYGQRYFKNHKRLSSQHDIICQTGISANIEPVTKELLAWKHPRGWLAIPDRDLGTLAWRHLHAQTKGYIANTARIPDAMPPSHFLCWQGRDHIHTYCCHQNAAWLSPRICMNAPNFFPATIDTRLPLFSSKFYVPQPEDEMTFIEMSGADKAAANFKIGPDDFAGRCWAQTGFSEDYMPYFMQPSKTPIHPQATYLDDATIVEQHRKVVDFLWSEKPPRWLAKLNKVPEPVV